MITSDRGAVLLLEAIYWQAVKDVIAEWRFADKHNMNRWSEDYCSAIAFLRRNPKGQRLLKILESLDDEQREELIKKGLTIDSGVQWDDRQTK